MGIIQSISDGLSLASILLLVALGLAITFGIMKVINLAHGELIMIGAYTTYVVSTIGELPFFASIILAFIVTGLVGIVIERLVIKRLYGRPLETLLATIGVSIILQELIRMIFGPGGKSVSHPISSSINIGNIIIPNYRLFIILFAVTLVCALLIIMYKTRIGIQLRAISQNRQMAESLGINTSRIDTLTFAFGSGLAGIAGAILAPMKAVSPMMGLEYLTDSFMVVVLGGVGSIVGTAAGATLIGELSQIMTTLSTATFAKLLIFIMVIFIIRFKPEGLFSSGGRK